MLSVNSVKKRNTKWFIGYLITMLLATGALAQTDSDRAQWAVSIFDGSKLSSEKDRIRILRFNFGPLLTRADDNASVFGYIGDNYQRLRVVILTATKQAARPETYDVTGKSMVKNVIRDFTGTIKITKTTSTQMSELDEDYKAAKVKEAGLVFGEYHFAEDAKQTNTGKFDGYFATNWVVDKSGRLLYDEVLVGADGYSNNQFAGTWTSYKTNISKPASWGDSRIPIAGDLDIGAGEFYPDEKYVVNGWQNYREAYAGQNKRALLEERRKWWK